MRSKPLKSDLLRLFVRVLPLLPKRHRSTMAARPHVHAEDEQQTLAAIAQSVLERAFASVRSGSARPGLSTTSWSLGDAWATFRNDAIGFAHAVTWTEPFIVTLVTLLAVYIAFAIAISRVSAWQPRAMLLVFQTGLILALQPLNTLASAHWRTFATQNYFDPHGVFLTVMVAAPLSLLSLWQVVRTRIVLPPHASRASARLSRTCYIPLFVRLSCSKRVWTLSLFPFLSLLIGAPRWVKIYTHFCDHLWACYHWCRRRH